MPDHLVVCSGWLGVHTDIRILKEGSGPTSHSMCAECSEAMELEASALHEKMVLLNQQPETHDPS